MQYTLPELGYAYDALEPHIDARTMEIHHTKHHQAYIDKLNAAMEKQPELSVDVYELMERLDEIHDDAVRTAVRNNGGGHANHSFFWKILSAQGGTPSDDLQKAIEESFGSMDAFKTQFSEAAVGRFGSGWAWLVAEGNTLSIMSTPNQDNPWMEGKKPILGLDVWEHAYYLKYQNKRPDYITAFWNVVNWNVVSQLFEQN